MNTFTWRAYRLCLLLIVTSLVTASASAADFYVATNGSNTTGDGSIGNPWATIEYAVGQVPDGSTSLVRPGTLMGAPMRRRRHVVLASVMATAGLVALVRSQGQAGRAPQAARLLAVDTASA